MSLRVKLLAVAAFIGLGVVIWTLAVVEDVAPSRPAPSAAPVPSPPRSFTVEADGSVIVYRRDGSTTVYAANGRARVGYRLLVLDRGVVEVPEDAIVTYMGRDKVVALAPDGSAWVYEIGMPPVARESHKPFKVGGRQ